MKITTEPVTHRHNVGECLACREYIWAEVDVVVEVGEPTLSKEGKASVYATARCVAMRVSHQCPPPADTCFCPRWPTPHLPEHGCPGGEST